MAGAMVLHAAVAEYIPFIVLLTALYTVAGGIHIRGNLHGSPMLNTGLLAIGAALASLMGTTGASMLMIRPLIRANDNRIHRTHIVVFFIFIVANAGGSLTPLGDPPLFLGFLKGVDFFWTVKHIFPETAFLLGSLLALFCAIDAWLYRREGVLPVDPTPDTRRIGFDGRFNFLLLGCIVGLVLLSGVWKSSVVFHVQGIDIGEAGPRGTKGLPQPSPRILHVLLDLSFLPPRRRVTEVRFEQVMARHSGKARVDLSDLAPANAIDRRPHIVKNTPLGNTAQHPERFSKRVEQHLVGLKRICPNNERPAV
jgi:hypothetical protein